MFLKLSSFVTISERLRIYNLAVRRAPGSPPDRPWRLRPAQSMVAIDRIARLGNSVMVEVASLSHVADVTARGRDRHSQRRAFTKVAVPVALRIMD